MSLLTLEALRARHGDCLLLHYGTNSKPRLMLIDGGPATTWGTTLKPRLAQLRPRYQDEKGVLQLALAMVSHIDDDHIQGMLDLTSELTEATDQQQTPWIEARTLWHNSFEELTGDQQTRIATLVDQATVQALSATGSAAGGVRDGAAVVASVAQGRRLRDEAELLGWRLNQPFGGLISAPAAGGRPLDLIAGSTRLLVLAPSQERIDDLRDEWEEQLRRLQRAGTDEAAIAAYVDKSVFNLSSIVCLVEAEQKRILLTGDARGDDILEAVANAGLLDNGPLAVDVFKLPHHGSDRNVAPDLFEKIVADHYVVSGDGRHGNPELETLQMLCDERTDDQFTLHLTYRDGPEELKTKLDGFLADRQANGRQFQVAFPDEAALSLRIDLLDPLPL
jgi:beta-lactamase superfamily II metal-dependent hydrolase